MNRINFFKFSFILVFSILCLWFFQKKDFDLKDLLLIESNKLLNTNELDVRKLQSEIWNTSMIISYNKTPDIVLRLTSEEATNAMKIIARQSAKAKNVLVLGDVRPSLIKLLSLLTEKNKDTYDIVMRLIDVQIEILQLQIDDAASLQDNTHKLEKESKLKPNNALTTVKEQERDESNKRLLNSQVQNSIHDQQQSFEHLWIAMYSTSIKEDEAKINFIANKGINSLHIKKLYDNLPNFLKN